MYLINLRYKITTPKFVLFVQSGPYLEMEGEADSSRLQLSKIILDQRGVHKNLVEATASTAAASGRTAQAPQQASLLAKPDLLVDFGNEYYDGRQDDVLPKFQEFTKKIVRTVPAVYNILTRLSCRDVDEHRYPRLD